MKLERLDLIAKIIAGQSPPSSTYNKDEEGLPFYQGKADFGEKNPIPRIWCAVPNKISVDKDILISVRAPVGSVNINNSKACIGRGLSAIRPNEKSYYEFLYFYFKVHEKQIAKLGVGSTFQSITQKDLSEIKIPLPPLTDQIKIAQILTKAEELIAQRKESIALLDEFLRSTFLEMFGDNEKFKQVPIKDIASKVKYSMSSGPFGSNLTSEHYTNEGVVILRGTNVTSGTLDLSKIKFVSEEKAKELERSEIRPNDIVIVAVGSSGKALLIPKDLPRAIISQNFNKITPDLSIVNPIYLEYSINSQFVQNQFERFMTDAGRTFLSLTNIKEILVPIPNLKLQEKFAGISEKIQILKSHYKSSLLELENLFGALSQKAFKGELDLSKMIIVEDEELISESHQKEIDPKPTENVEVEKKTKPVKEKSFTQRSMWENTSILGKISNLQFNNVEGEAVFKKVFSKKDKGFSFVEFESFIKKEGFKYEYHQLKDFIFSKLASKELTQYYADKEWMNESHRKHISSTQDDFAGDGSIYLVPKISAE